ncbi:membrane protein [Streptomyces sp. F-3]|uniref:Ferric reductase-like transmembrane domain-containing protein n=1 Tax=Streptomyces thermogriseus TaxID=75292 RepID=A0ABP4DDP4_9ACTN|nr:MULTISPECIES: ferric reductase-like transmembrane domain-containing protein [Streptomyces]MDN5385124.1 ferric reductase-like transmembrane domain-containing protein [Streptomyces sp. LB8]GAT80312.1 membrane protein [Streptomyces sp. F-3]
MTTTANGSTLDNTILDFLNFGAGVLSLVNLSCSVIWGLIAQDRILLNIRLRIAAQAVHRVTAVASIVFLLVHIVTKLVTEHTTWIAAVIPFGLLLTDDDPLGRGFLIGLGSVAALLMLFVGATGVLRNRFATPAPVAARWRSMHMLAYPAWCAALIHGLYAGRAAKPIFMILYGLSVLGVLAVLIVRASPMSFKRKLSNRLMSYLDAGERPELDALEASRARVAESALPGFGDRGAKSSRTGATGSSSLYGASASAASSESSGFAAAYRTAPSSPGTQPTEAMPRTDGAGGAAGGWPIPSPPPVGEAPPSAYDPLNDTGYNIPTYNSSGATTYSGRDVRDTGETNTPYGTYNPSDTYNSGPTPSTPPGASQNAPGSGEPWNTPSGGYR